MATKAIRNLLKTRREDSSPFTPPTAREQHQAERRRQRRETSEVAAGERCATCGYPADMPNCASCPSDT
jgi:hypothetical protein